MIKRTLKWIGLGYLLVTAVVVYVGYAGNLVRQLYHCGIPQEYLSNPIRWYADKVFDDFKYFVGLYIKKED